MFPRLADPVLADNGFVQLNPQPRFLGDRDLTIDLTQRNFLGKGYEASIRIRAGALTQQGVISFTDPWFLDRPLSAGFDIYSTMRVYTDYTYNSTGLAVRLSHPGPGPGTVPWPARPGCAAGARPRTGC